MAKLISTLTSQEFPFDRIEEFTDDGESLEVQIKNIKNAKIREGKFLFQRFAEFLPFDNLDEKVSLGEGHTSLLKNQKLSKFAGIENLLLKNETTNPTWSFKDRGSLACIFMAKQMNEKITATISTGNMGHSISAYAAKSDIQAIVFVPDYTPKEKIMAMQIHGATVAKVIANDYSEMKKKILDIAPKIGLRIVSGNGAIRVEGYKLTAFELYEQLDGRVPDYIAVPTSACGHIRGIFKGYKELQQAGLIERLPKMIVVQPTNNSPLVSAIKQGKDNLIPFTNFHTVAEALTSGNPLGGDEIVQKAKQYEWLAEDVSEEEILTSQIEFAKAGYFIEPASATSLFAVKKLKEAGKIEDDATVVLMLTGSGLKDMDVFKSHTFSEKIIKEEDLEIELPKLVDSKS